MDQPTKTICAWCGTLIRDGKMPITHGMCRACADRMLAEMMVAEQRAKKEGRCHLTQH